MPASDIIYNFVEKEHKRKTLLYDDGLFRLYTQCVHKMLGMKMKM